MGKIVQMSSELATTIAAGEVIERPVNIIKELIENSIDAGSTKITVELIESGLKMIQITDNGEGMDSQDAKLCFSRNATSKIKHLSDMESINTLGFRGEALPSIAAVASVKLETSNGNESTLVEIENSKINTFETDLDFVQGTKLTISKLFVNTPVRLKHLSSKYRELALISDLIKKMSLIYPNIEFNLINDGKSNYFANYQTMIDNKLRKIFNLENSTKVYTIDAETLDYSVKIYLVEPIQTKINKSGIIVSYNSRLISNYQIQSALIDGTNGYRMHERFPIGYIQVNSDPYLTDVNIHPNKQEIKISKINELKLLIEQTVSSWLKENETVSQIVPPIELEPISANENFNLPNEQFELIKNSEFTKDEPLKTENYKMQEVEEKNDYKLYEAEMIVEEISNFIGQFMDSYLIFEKNSQLMLIDQHAAQERINYEKILAKLLVDNNSIKQRLITPFIYSYEEWQKPNLEILKSIGYEFTLGENVILINYIPNFIDQKELSNYTNAILSNDFKEFDKRYIYEFAALKSCKMSLKANQRLTGADALLIFDELFKCDNYLNCPHGRPIIFQFSKKQLDKMFKRI